MPHGYCSQGDERIRTAVVVKPAECRYFPGAADGFHLAGAIDGEGSFAIVKRPKGSAYVCQFIRAWASRDWQRMAVLHDLIRSVREYDAPAPVIPASPQLRMVTDAG